MSIEHELENRCPKCGHPWVKHGGDEVTALCPSPPVTSRVAARIIRTQRVAQASARTSARQLLADARGILDADGGQDAAELVKRIDALETEDRAVEAGLAFLLTRKCRDCGGNRKHFDGCEKFRPSPRKVGKALPPIHAIIGSLIDAWEQMPNDLRDERLDRRMADLVRYIEEVGFPCPASRRWWRR